MTPERWPQITGIFHAALARDAAERQAFVAASCREDAEVRREVESMLAAHEQADGFGEAPKRAVRSTAESSMSPVALQAGTRLGPYEVGSLLGVGGMGAVYRARDTRLHRDVAVKCCCPRLSTIPIGWPASAAKRVYSRH